MLTYFLYSAAERNVILWTPCTYISIIPKHLHVLTLKRCNYSYFREIKTRYSKSSAGSKAMNMRQPEDFTFNKYKYIPPPPPSIYNIRATTPASERRWLENKLENNKDCFALSVLKRILQLDVYIEPWRSNF